MRSRWLLLLVACGCGDEAKTFTRKERLSETGLYTDIASKSVAASNVLYTPRFALWSDAADKTRWLSLPEGASIDESDADHWRFPKGSKLFKEFIKDGKRIETRLIEKHGDGDDDIAFATYVWRDDESDADLADDGRIDARGTGHDVPATAVCMDCHGGEPGRVLGYSAVQVSETYVAPGNEVEAAAIGYLHANCGSCHNPHGAAAEQTGLTVRLSLSHTDLASTGVMTTAVGVGVSSWRTMDYETLIVPGQPDQSALLARMLRRDRQQMPPVATELVDEAGSDLLRAFIESLE